MATLKKKTIIYGSIFQAAKQNSTEDLFISISQPNQIGYLAYEKLSPSGKYSLLANCSDGALIVQVSSKHQPIKNIYESIGDNIFLASVALLEPGITCMRVNLNILTTLAAINLGWNPDGSFDRDVDLVEIKKANFRLAKTFWDELGEMK